MTADVVIRTEQDTDHAAIAAVVRAAFTDNPDRMALLVERIRASVNFVPKLSVVAEDDSGVIGYTMVSWVGLRDSRRTRILDLGPVAVRPDRQRQGVGSKLVGAALERIEATGEPFVMVEGIPEYYPQFGFERARPLGFVPPFSSIPDGDFMVKRLAGYEPELAGHVVYPPAFDHIPY